MTGTGVFAGFGENQVITQPAVRLPFEGLVALR